MKTNGQFWANVAEKQGIPLRTLADVQETLKWSKGDQAMIRLMIKHGRLTPEAYRYLESFLVECPKCGLLNGHRFPCQ